MDSGAGFVGRNLGRPTAQVTQYQRVTNAARNSGRHPIRRRDRLEDRQCVVRLATHCHPIDAGERRTVIGPNAFCKIPARGVGRRDLSPLSLAAFPLLKISSDVHPRGVILLLVNYPPIKARSAADRGYLDHCTPALYVIMSRRWTGMLSGNGAPNHQFRAVQ